MIKNPDLKERIKIPGTPIEKENEVGEIYFTPGEYFEIWARVDGLTGRESIEAQKIRPEQTYRITVRFREDIDPAMIIEWRGKKLELVTPAKDLDGRRCYTTFDCIEKVR